MFMLSFGSLPRVHRNIFVKWFSIFLNFKEYDGNGVLMFDTKAMNKNWYDFSILRIIDSAEGSIFMTFDAVKDLFNVDWDELRSHNNSFRKIRIGKVSQIGSLARINVSLTEKSK